jgi:hypothetical protein
MLAMQILRARNKNRLDRSFFDVKIGRQAAVCPIDYAVHLFLSSLSPQGAPGCVFCTTAMIPLDAQFYSTWREATLVLTRKIGEEIIIDEDICVTIVGIRGD